MTGRQISQRRLACFTLALAASAAVARADVPATPPAYTPVRWNEDYSYLKNAPASADPLDKLKYIPLNDSGDVYLSLGGQARYRYEYFNNANFGVGPQDDDGFHLTRLMANADLHLGPNVRVFVQGISAYEDQRTGGPRPQDANELDLHQAFVDLILPFSNDNSTSLTLRGGRQNLLYGAERLISPLDWTNTRRTFDGFKASLKLGDQTIDAFAVEPELIQRERVDYPDDHAVFAGVYDTILLPAVLPHANTRLELYGLYLGLAARGAKPASLPPIAAIGVSSDTYTVGAVLHEPQALRPRRRGRLSVWQLRQGRDRRLVDRVRGRLHVRSGRLHASGLFRL